MPRRLNASSTFLAAHGWYGAASRPAGRSFDDSDDRRRGIAPAAADADAAVGFLPLSALRAAALPHARQVRLPVGGAGNSRWRLATGACAVSEASAHMAIADDATTMNARISAPPRRESLLHRLSPREVRRTFLPASAR